MTSRTISFPLLICISLYVFGFCNNRVYADQESFPFLAESTGDHVNVRAGQSANFEQLCQLSKGEEVAIVGKEYSWYKIQLPSHAKSFVSNKFVEFIDDQNGTDADAVPYSLSFNNNKSDEAGTVPTSSKKLSRKKSNKNLSRHTNRTQQTFGRLT